jgi:ArsR family transcriptional regulator
MRNNKVRQPEVIIFINKSHPFQDFRLTISALADIVSLMKNHVQLFKTLADETRLRILMLLYAEGELCVCDIIAALLLPQSTVSRHLATLKKSAMVIDRREGLWIYYSINRNNLLMAEMEPFLKKGLQESSISANDHQRLLNYDHNCA